MSSSTVLASSSPSRCLRKHSFQNSIRDMTAPPSSPPVPDKLPELRGTKRQALLPAFDFDGELSSSPPRPYKRRHLIANETDSWNETSKENINPVYPTPQPSSDAIAPTSPRLPERPSLTRKSSALLEIHGPLVTLPPSCMPASGEMVTIGRAKNSTIRVTDADHLISRTHIKANFLPTANPPKITVECVGWNGATLHCQGHSWHLKKNQVWSSDKYGCLIMIDMHETRVPLTWPLLSSKLARSELVDENSPLPTKSNPIHKIPRISITPDGEIDETPELVLADSPLAAKSMDAQKKKSSMLPPKFHTDDAFRESRFQNKGKRLDDSPTPMPRSRSFHDKLVDSLTSQAPVQIYEDVEEDETFVIHTVDEEVLEEDVPQENVQEATSENEEQEETEDPDERIDCIQVNENAVAVTTEEADTSTSTVSPPAVVDSPKIKDNNPLSPQSKTTACIHLTNQLAYSRLSSVPLATLHTSLPSIISPKLTTENVVSLLKEIECIGEIRREGKDAAGQPLQSEYYYIPDRDDDESRKQAITGGLGKTGLRACRKTHKQYYWKRPRALP